jgi:hypothetical protein
MNGLNFLRFGFEPARRPLDDSDNMYNDFDHSNMDAGNIKLESYQDSNGNVKRQVARTFDALSRVEKVEKGKAPSP